MNSTKTPVGSTTLESIAVYLPIGDVNANYALQLIAEIQDIYGAVTSFNFSTITVRLFISLFLFSWENNFV